MTYSGKFERSLQTAAVDFCKKSAVVNRCLYKRASEPSMSPRAARSTAEIFRVERNGIKTTTTTCYDHVANLFDNIARVITLARARHIYLQRYTRTCISTLHPRVAWRGARTRASLCKDDVDKRR